MEWLMESYEVIVKIGTNESSNRLILRQYLISDGMMMNKSKYF